MSTPLLKVEITTDARSCVDVMETAAEVLEVSLVALGTGDLEGAEEVGARLARLRLKLEKLEAWTASGDPIGKELPF